MRFGSKESRLGDCVICVGMLLQRVGAGKLKYLEVCLGDAQKLLFSGAKGPGWSISLEKASDIFRGQTIESFVCDT